MNDQTDFSLSSIPGFKIVYGLNYIMLNISRTGSVSWKFTEQNPLQGHELESRNHGNKWGNIQSDWEIHSRNSYNTMI